MQLKNQMSNAFLTLRIGMTTEKALEIIDLYPIWEKTHVIFFRPNNQEYYLFHRKEVERKLYENPPDSFIDKVFQLDHREPTPIHSIFDDADEAPSECVILDLGHILGFVDFNQPVGFNRTYVPQDPIASDEIIKVLGADFPEKIKTGDIESLLISISEDQELFSREVKIKTLKNVMIEIHVISSQHLDLVGHRKIFFRITDSENPVFKFDLRAIKPGKGVIRIIIFINEDKKVSQSSTIILGTEVYEEKTWIEPISRNTETKFVAAPRSSGADLQLTIVDQKIPSGNVIDVIVHYADPSIGVTNYRGSKVFEGDIREYIRSKFIMIEKSSVEEINHRLNAVGINLFREFFPNSLHRIIWEIRDKIQSIHIISDEPHIPWELCRLVGTNRNGEEVFGNFLSEDFELTRWRFGFQKRSELKLSHLAYVAPSDSGLFHDIDEIQFFKTLTKAGIRIDKVPARFQPVVKHLQEAPIEGLHFIGHGKTLEMAYGQSILQLANGEEISSEDITGFKLNGSPLIFLNACQVGSSGMSLAEIGGFAQQFLRVGAAAFIAPIWNVNDKAAFEFARAFYSELITGATIGQSVKKARSVAKRYDETAWLAYTVFADPQARIK